VAKSKTSSNDSVVLFRNSQGVEARGTLVRLSRHQAVVEVYNPYSIVQLSEVLEQMQIRRGDRVIYRGRAVVSNLVSTGVMLIVSATLVDPWSELVSLSPGDELRQEVSQFVEDWEATYRSLSPRYQSAVGRLRNFFEELSRWLIHSETAAGLADGGGTERMPEFLGDVSAHVDPKLAELCGAFEHEASAVDPQTLAAHKEFARRELHPLTLCSPFIHRTFTKPLGYAGDYEMVNMMFRNPWEGQNSYARIVNSIIINSDGAKAHRNRIDRLEWRLVEEAKRVSAAGRPLRVLNIGCGPAVEVQRFIRNHELSERCRLDLMDFNDETLAYAQRQIEAAIRDSGRKPEVRFIHESIHGLLKGASGHGRDNLSPQRLQAYDLVYCAGLFDYLSDRICGRLLRLFYAWGAPDAMILATNVHPDNPVRYFIEHLLEWNLIYRDQAQMRRLAPQEPGATHELWTEACGVNVFVETRKPGGGDS
jgi:extracellular factor (EF) 3-hydroxypalmitic acid methyl ester biosynthesis protein